MSEEYKPVILTPMGAFKLKEALKKQESMVGIRVGIIGGGCSGYLFSMDFIKQEDIKEESDFSYLDNGVLLVVDEISAGLLNQTVIDYEESLVSSGFRFHNDKVRTCGCGSSFKVEK